MSSWRRRGRPPTSSWSRRKRAASEQLEQEEDSQRAAGAGGERAASEQIHDIIKNVAEAYHITAGEAMDVLKILALKESIIQNISCMMCDMGMDAKTRAALKYIL